jgi:hypothetical protein
MMYITRNMEFNVAYGSDAGAGRSGSGVGAGGGEVSEEMMLTAGSDAGSSGFDDDVDVESRVETYLGRVVTNVELPPDGYASGDRVKGRSEWSVQRRWVRATRVGHTLVTARMLPIHSKLASTTWTPEHEILTLSEIVVSEQVSMYSPKHHSPILLPPLEQQYKLVARGGTGRYLWKSSDSELASIGPNGNITVQAYEGTSTIHVSDEANQFNFAEAPVEIAEVNDIRFLSGPIETEVDANSGGAGGDDEGANDLYLHVGAVDKQRRTFHACTSLAKDIDVDMDVSFYF